MVFAYAGLILIFVAAVAVISIRWRIAKAQPIIERWAQEQGLKLLRVEYRDFFRGPFMLRSSKSQAVFFVSVQDASGQVRDGHVRVGGFFRGLKSDEIDVRWNS